MASSSDTPFDFPVVTGTATRARHRVGVRRHLTHQIGLVSSTNTKCVPTPLRSASSGRQAALGDLLCGQMELVRHRKHHWEHSPPPSDAPRSQLPLARIKRACVFMAIFLFLMTLAPSAVTAKWRRPNDIFFGTAYTLPEDRMRIGLFAPLSYGVHDRVTLSSHPILALLLTPNASARIKLVDKRVIISVAAAYTQSFYVDNEAPASGQTRFFGIATLPVTERFLLTTTGGVAQNLTDDARSVEASLCAHYRLDQQNIIMIQGAVSNTLDLDDDTSARGLFFYALAFDSFKAGAGVAVGKMPESLASIPLKNDELRAIPYVDIWWSF